jgi:hypothetical protein
VEELVPAPRFEDITAVYGLADRVFTIDRTAGYVYEIFINNGTVGRCDSISGALVARRQIGTRATQRR